MDQRRGVPGRVAAAWFWIGALGVVSIAPTVGRAQPLATTHGRPSTDPPAVLVRLRPGVEAPRGAVALGQASFARASAKWLAVGSAPELGLEASPALAGRALQEGVQAIEAPYRGLDLEDAPGVAEGPGARLMRTFRLVLAP